MIEYRDIKVITTTRATTAAAAATPHSPTELIMYFCGGN
jgi:hypothetical protein